MCVSNFGSLWLGLSYRFIFHGCDRLLSAANEAAREDEVDTFVCAAMAIEQDEATPVYGGREGRDGELV